MNIYEKIVSYTNKIPFPFDIPSDKKAHYIIGFLISFIVSMVLNNPITGFLFGCLAAVAKEIRDQIVYQGFDYKDLIVTVLGVFLGSSLAYLIMVTIIYW